MSRIRTVKPELLRHEDLFDAELACGLPLRLAFIGLFTVADCEGRFIWKPRTLKLDVLPHDGVDFAAVLAALEAAGFIQRYTVEGRTYGLIPTFTKHQNLPAREVERGSALPAPPEPPALIDSCIDTNPARTEHEPIHAPARTDSCSESQEGKGIGREGNRKGKEKESAPARNARSPKTPLPVDLAITEPLQAWAIEQGYLENLTRHLDAFRDKAQANGYRYTDWQAALRNAIRDDWAGLRRSAPHPQRSASGPGGGRTGISPALARAEALHASNQAAIAEWLSQEPALNGSLPHATH